MSTVRIEETSNKDLNSKRTKRTKDTNKLKEIGRDETLSMLHGVGRVLNPKYDAAKHLTHSPEGITDAFCTQPSNFLLFLFSNYLTHFSSIPDSAACLHELSMSDYLSTEYRDQALPIIALNIGIRGAMVSNSAPVSGWHPVKGHRKDKTREENVDAEYTRFLKDGRRNLVSKNTFVLDYKGGLGKILNVSGGTKGDLEEDTEELNLINDIEMVDSD